MSVEQFYYTSWVDQSPGGEAGFHVRGKSPGITPQDERLLLDLIAYEIPPRLDSREIATHPVALRYAHIAPQRSVLLCAQSIGVDEQGRSGNFFAHAVLLAPDMFTHTPPAFYWKSPFWRVSESAPGTTIPALPSFEVEPALDLEQVWRFIADTRRRDWLYHLLCAVIHSRSTQRRVVIVDTPEHVALWAAVTSLLLPSLYRPLLTFATYHSDPYRSSYLLTGIRSDMGFQLGQAEFLSFFILDTESGRVGEAPDSLYARIAVECAQPDLFEERMLNLLGLCDRLFPPANGIGEDLDDAAAYYTRASAAAGAVDPRARRAMKVAITSLGQGDALRDERLDDLRDAYTLLAGALAEAPDAELIQDFEQVATMLRAADPQGASACLAHDLALATRLIASGATQAGSDLSDAMRRVYGDGAVVEGLNLPDYLRDLLPLCARAPLPDLLNIWQFIGKSVRASPTASPALATTLKRAQMTSDTAGASTEEQVASALADATRANGQAWLAILSRDASIPVATLWAYYYALVQRLSPEERMPYRAQMPRAEALAAYEIERDLRDTSVGAAMDTLERWGAFAQTQPGSDAWVTTGLNHLWRTLPPRNLSEAAKHALTRPFITEQMDAPSEETLLHTALTGIPLARPDGLTWAVCQRYGRDGRLNAAERTLMLGVFAMHNGQLDHRSAEELRRRFSSLSPEQYASESRDFITRFFELDVTRDAHAQMVVATYSLQYGEEFWQSYGSALLTLMIEPKAAKRVVSLLGFWFDASLSVLGGYPYVVQSFFMWMPQLFESAQKERSYRDAAREIDRYASREPWYPLVKGMVTPERRGILGRFGL